MVNFALSSTIAFSLFISQHVIAAPSTAAAAPAAPAVASRSSSKDTRFSFADWVDTIIANPETALKPREAVQAFIDSMNATTESANSSSSNGLEEKRWDSQVECVAPGAPEKYLVRAIDAAYCINEIAARGQEACVPMRKPNKYNVWMSVYCGYRTAIVVPFGPDIRAGNTAKYGTCQSIAQTAGAIMDTCTELRESGNYLWGGMRKYGLTGNTAGVGIFWDCFD